MTTVRRPRLGAPGLGAMAERLRHPLPWRIQRPVFIIGPPRSGSTMLFEALAQFDELSSFTHREGGYLWRWVLPYDKRATKSDAIHPTEFGPWRRRLLKAFFYLTAATRRPGAGPVQRVRLFLRSGPMRYLDKSISNCFRLDLIREMFPDASFVFIVREPRANVASMLAGWERFGKPVLNPYLRAAGSTLSHWTYGTPPGWQEVLDRELPEICAWSWQQHAEAILRFRETQPGPLVRYEDLVDDPLTTVSVLAPELGLAMTEEIREYLRRPPHSRTTLTPPAPSKWRDQRPEDIEAALASVADTAARLGY